MIAIENYVSISWALLYVGLKNNWLTPKQVVKLINENIEKGLAATEEEVIDLNVNDEDQFFILNTLETKGGKDEAIAKRIWQTIFLAEIEKSNKTIKEKLEDIAIQWARLDYPNEWRGFIHYLPVESEKRPTNSWEGVYQHFLDFLSKEKQSFGLNS